jgi:predicted ATP-dependent endonuclease of OLD family
MERFEADETFRQRVLAFVREADLAIESIDVERTTYGQDPISLDLRGWMSRSSTSYPERMMLRETQPTIARVTTRHQVYDHENRPAGWETFDLTAQESEGTQKIFYLCGPLIEALDKGRVLVIDEMEARLHPFITRAIIQLFHSSQTNPHSAQLIFCTHDTSLLDRHRFRRDQIWFTEKDRYGATDLYSLAELQVRNDASFDKDYIAGKYGAVPFIGGLQALFEGDIDGETAQAERA